MSRNKFVLAAGALSAVFGCTAPDGQQLDGARTSSVRQALGETVATDKTTYDAGESVVISVTNMPGNYYDWVALAPVGAPPEQYTRYGYLFGQQNGSVTLVGPPAGQYVARAFLNNTYTVLAESAPLTIRAQAGTTTVTTSKASYQPSESVSISYSGMAGYATDWLSLARPGAAETDYIRWTYTGGQLAGGASFPLTGLDGAFVVRAHFNNGNAIAAESAPFTVEAANTTVTTDKTTYAFNETVNVSYANMLGNSEDWISIAPQGSPPEEFSWWEYSSGGFAGSLSLSTLPPGTFVARAYFADTFVVRAESAPFTVATTNFPVTLTTSKAAYSGIEPVNITFSGMAGTPTDWIGAYEVDDDSRRFRGWTYVGGVSPTSGQVNLYYLRAGTWQVRAFFNDNVIMQGASATFTVSTAVATDKSTYNVGEDIVVNYGGMFGSPKDWVSFAQPGAAPNLHYQYKYTAGANGGLLTFPAAPLGAGTYVARVFFDDGFTVAAESAPFTVTE